MVDREQPAKRSWLVVRKAEAPHENRSHFGHKKVSENLSPPRTPPSPSNESSIEGSPQKNISLSLSPQVGNTSFSGRIHIGLETVEKKKEEEEIERYKKINSVIADSGSSRPPPRRYRKNAVRDRCRQFAQDLEAEGFIAGNKFEKRKLRYWIIALDLAHDKTTVKQYFERLVIYGYFILNKRGKYVFCGSLRPNQLSLIDPKIIRARTHASLYQDRRIKRRSY